MSCEWWIVTVCCDTAKDLERYFKGTGLLFCITALGAAILMPFLGILSSGQTQIDTCALLSTQSIKENQILPCSRDLVNDDFAGFFDLWGFCTWDRGRLIMADCQRWHRRMRLGFIPHQQSNLPARLKIFWSFIGKQCHILQQNWWGQQIHWLSCCFA